MKTVLVAFNSKFSHSSLAIRYIRQYNDDLDMEIAEFTINEGAHRPYAELLQKKADIYCFSTYIWNIEVVQKVARMLKQALPQCIIVFGGPECGYRAKDVLDTHEYVDYVVVGEGEKVTGELIKAIQSGSPIPGAVAARGKEDAKAECMVLDTVAFPYTIEEMDSLKNKIIYFETSRGCPFKCSYCLSAIEKGIRYFPMEYVKKGFDFFFSHGVSLVKLVDRTFNAHPKRAEEIIRYIISNSKGTRVHFEIDPSILTPELTELLASAPKGMFQLEMGIQSTNQKTLSAVDRKCDENATAHNIKTIKDADNIHIHLDLIAGLPYEDYESFGNSFNYVYSLRPDMLQLGFLKVLHGAPIKDFKGIVHADFPPYEVIKTDWISAEELCRLKLIDKAVDEIQNSGAFESVLEKLAAENPFGAFEKMSQIFDRAEAVGRFEIYDRLYDIYGEYIFDELVYDFIKNSKTRPMPRFAEALYPTGFKKSCLKILAERFPETDAEDVRFELIRGELLMMNYKSGELIKLNEKT